MRHKWHLHLHKITEPKIVIFGLIAQGNSLWLLTSRLGILLELWKRMVLSRGNFWRLRDAQGKPPVRDIVVFSGCIAALSRVFFVVVKVWFCFCYFLPAVSFLSYCHNSRSTGFGVLTYGCGCNVLDGITVVNVVVVAVISLVVLSLYGTIIMVVKLLYWLCGDMLVVRFHSPFVGLSGCHDGSGNRLTKTSLITHLHDSDFNGDAQAITKNSLTTTITVFLGDFVPPPDCGNGIVRFVLYDLTKPQVASSFVQLDHVGDLVLDKHDGFTLPLSCVVV
ncbi:hypothetical protein Tco_0515068 [Tanacetum coccineum]